jgi:hypothetical protein
MMTFVCSMCQNNMLLNNLAFTYEFVDDKGKIVTEDTSVSMWRLCRMKTFVCVRCGARHEYNWGYAPKKCARCCRLGRESKNAE